MSLPSFSVDDITFEVLLRDPSGELPDGTALVPDAAALSWSKVPLVPDPAACEHAETVCSECADDWGIDHFCRVSVAGRLVWASDDAPPAG